jgi:hypothetical protein
MIRLTLKVWLKLMSDLVRLDQGMITAVRESEDGFLDVYATFLAEGELEYWNGGEKQIEFLPWSSITHADSLQTATLKPITLMHPDTADSLLKADQYRQYSRGMTGSKIYLDYPFAVVVCGIGDGELASKIKNGDVKTVSSCRRTQMMKNDSTGQLIQGPWRANHLAFIDGTKGERGRSPHAKVHYGPPPSQNPDPGITYIVKSDSYNYRSTPDYSKFVAQDLGSGQIVYLPTSDTKIDQSSKIVIPASMLDSNKSESEESMNKKVDATTPAVEAEVETEAPELTANDVANAIRPLFDEFITKFTGAMKVTEARADSTAEATYTQAELDARLREAEQRGLVVSTASRYLGADDLTSVGKTSTADLAVKTLKAINPKVVADSTMSTEALVAMLTTAIQCTPDKTTEFKGALVPDVKSDSEKEEPVDRTVEIMRAALTKQQEILSGKVAKV